MKILIINCYFKEILLDLGHEVLEFNTTKSGIYDIASILNKKKFSPDIIIQKEILGVVIIISGLHLVCCKTVFWSIDTHLNYFWQIYYSRLFDVIFTPHKQYINETASFSNKHKLVWLPSYAGVRKFIPHRKRKSDINIVARLSGERYCRDNLEKILKQFYNKSIIGGIGYEKMLSTYDDTKIIPNESIALETNFRILEGASCGCCVISPQIGADQDNMFAVDKEILVYNDAQDLIYAIDYCKAHTNYAEDIGLAAWERVQSEHLLEHRVHAILNELTDKDLSCKVDEDFLNVTICILSISQKILVPNYNFYFKNIKCETLKSIVIITEKIFHEDSSGAEEIISDMLRMLKASCCDKQDIVLSLATLCGGYSLYRKKLDLSHDFLEAYKTHSSCDIFLHKNEPTTDTDLYSCWINQLYADGRCLLYGMIHSGYTQTAFDFILMNAQSNEQGSLWAKELLVKTAIAKRNPMLSQGAAARLALNDPSIENNMKYIEQSLRFLDIERAKRTAQDILEQIPVQNSKAAIKKILLKKHPILTKFLEDAE